VCSFRWGDGVSIPPRSDRTLAFQGKILDYLNRIVIKLAGFTEWPGREKISKKKFHSSIFKKVFDKQKTQTQKPKRNELKTKTFFLQSFLFEND
jgi:hypothetical protein